MPNTDTNDCVKTILGRPVPLIIIHALVSLRGAIKSVRNFLALSRFFYISDDLGEHRRLARNCAGTRHHQCLADAVWRKDLLDADD
jgi:hypothetical protein